jgi:hypothetical protein
MLSLAIASPYAEGEIGMPLAAIQKAHPETSIGSYPRYIGQKFSTEIVVRGRSQAAVDAAGAEVHAMIEDIRKAREISENHSAEA